jgi:hypothetical protein
VIGQQSSTHVDVPARGRDKAVQLGEHRRKDHRTGPARAQEHPVSGRADRTHGQDVAIRYDSVVRVGPVEIEEDGPSRG